MKLERNPFSPFSEFTWDFITRYVVSQAKISLTDRGCGKMQVRVKFILAFVSEVKESYETNWQRQISEKSRLLIYHTDEW